MYILFNRDLMTIPYKHPDPFVLCDMTIIEFPADYVEILPAEKFAYLDDLSLDELTTLYYGLGCEPTDVVSHETMAGSIQAAILDADVSNLPKYNVLMQARAFEPDRTTRHRFNPQSYLPDLHEVSEPNCSNIAKSSRQSLQRLGDDTPAATILTSSPPTLESKNLQPRIIPPWERQDSLHL